MRACVCYCNVGSYGGTAAGRPGGLASGRARMLLVLVREFESRRGEI